MAKVVKSYYQKRKYSDPDVVCLFFRTSTYCRVTLMYSINHQSSQQYSSRPVFDESGKKKGLRAYLKKSLAIAKRLASHDRNRVIVPGAVYVKCQKLLQNYILSYTLTFIKSFVCFFSQQLHCEFDSIRQQFTRNLMNGYRTTGRRVRVTIGHFRLYADDVTNPAITAPDSFEL